MTVGKKRIFVISPYPVYPVADGCARRIDGICQLLVAKGFEVYLFAPQVQGSGKRAVLSEGAIHMLPYSRKRKKNYFINFDLFHALKKHVVERPHLIILNFPYLSKIVCPFARKHKIPVHLEAHNVEHQRFKNMGRPLVAMLIYLFERYAVKNVQSVSVTSKIDADTFKKKFGRESTVIENFIDTEIFFPIKKEDKVELKRSLGMNFPKIASYFGNFSNISTKQAYEIIRDEIAPRLMLKDPQIKIAVVGKGLKKGKSPVENMVIVGEVDRIEQYIQVSDVVIVPLVSGGGTRYKILEALGCGIPVLSTPKGNEGLDLKLEDGVILSNIKEFPEKIAEFFNNESSSTRIHPNLKNILSKYSLSGISKRINLQKTFGLSEIDSHEKNKKS
jgi:glycosyltransferase involved in cell wall biosynthesis